MPRLARARGVAKLEQLLRQMDDDGVRPDATLLNTLLGGYARTLQYERAFELIRSWTARGVSPDATSYAHLMRACVGARVPGRATAALQSMRDAGFTHCVCFNMREEPVVFLGGKACAQAFSDPGFFLRSW